MEIETINQHTADETFMRRCLQLARGGRLNAKPNPMVGAVIVGPDGRIIGEGYHVRCGEGHAEVNAFASVKACDEHLLPQSTMYVSLEPCSHYGKTPPCADLIIKKGVRKVVVGCVDTFAKVDGRGIEKLRNAGIEVEVGALEKECRELNRRFFTFNSQGRPYFLLKWAQSIDGFIDDHFRATTFSTPFTQMLSHKLRAENDAIIVGRVTDDRDKPRLDTRLWPGRNPKRIVLRKGDPSVQGLSFDSGLLTQLAAKLHSEGCQSAIVEGGAYTLQRFIEADLWDEIRVETAPFAVGGGTPAPELPANIYVSKREEYDGNTIVTFRPKTAVTQS